MELYWCVSHVMGAVWGPACPSPQAFTLLSRPIPLQDNLTLELRVTPPEITIDNNYHESFTFVKMSSANRPGSLIHVRGAGGGADVCHQPPRGTAASPSHAWVTHAGGATPDRAGPPNSQQSRDQLRGLVCGWCVPPRVNCRGCGGLGRGPWYGPAVGRPGPGPGHDMVLGGPGAS